MVTLRVFTLAFVILALAWSASAAEAQAVGRGGVPLALASPRIGPLDEKDFSDEQRALLTPLFRERGSVPNLYRTLVRHPKMFTPRYNFGNYIKSNSTLAARDREILICRIAWLSGAEYEWSAHTAIARRAGLSDADIRRLAIGPDAAGWNDSDRAVMRAVDELYDDAFIGDATWQALAGRLKQEQMMDLTMTVGTYHMLAMLLRSCGVPLEQSAFRFSAVRQDDSRAPVPARPAGKAGVSTRLKTPRIAPVAEANWTATDRELLEPLKVERGYVPNVYNTLSRHPDMYRLWLAYARYILRDSTMPAREREMLILRIAYLAGGEYEWSAHSRRGMEAGLKEEEVLRTAQPDGGSGWSDADQALISAVDELHRDCFIPDPLWSKLTSRYNTQQMMDLVLTVGAYKMLAMGLNSFGAQLDSNMSGFPKAGR